MKKCTLIMNTKNGYILTPKECKSIAEAIRTANAAGLAYRVIIDGKTVKAGWNPNV